MLCQDEPSPWARTECHRPSGGGDPGELRLVAAAPSFSRPRRRMLVGGSDGLLGGDERHAQRWRRRREDLGPLRCSAKSIAPVGGGGDRHFPGATLPLHVQPRRKWSRVTIARCCALRHDTNGWRNAGHRARAMKGGRQYLP